MSTPTHSDDVLVRLRRHQNNCPTSTSVLSVDLKAAGDEIERLRAEVADAERRIAAAGRLVVAVQWHQGYWSRVDWASERCERAVLDAISAYEATSNEVSGRPTPEGRLYRCELCGSEHTITRGNADPPLPWPDPDGWTCWSCQLADQENGRTDR